MELEREGLEGIEISFTDNKPVLDLFLSKPIGLLSLLNDQCRGLNVSHVTLLEGHISHTLTHTGLQESICSEV